MKHRFLSDEWLAAVDEVLEREATVAPPGTDIVMNVAITDTPFGVDREVHVGATGGNGHWGHGFRDDANVTITTDYETAREIFVAADPAVGMQAFLTGRVRVQGDLAKLLAAQAAAAAAFDGRPGPLQLAIEALTE